MSNAVIIPARGAGKHLPQCLESIAQQTKRPTLVLIGCDACPETLAVAAQAQQHYGLDLRKKGALRISVYYFPAHSYPYRIRNTLATEAAADVLHFFDADDLMYRDHIEKHLKGVKQGQYVVANAEIQRENGVEPWTRAHGVVSLTKVDFIGRGGFEPWACAADTEARQRWADDLSMVTTSEPTMLVRKHDTSLTQAEHTGYGSDTRNAYKAEIERRAGNHYRLWSLGIAPYVEYTGQAIDTLVHTDALEPSMECEQESAHQGTAADETELHGLRVALSLMMRVHGRGINVKERKAYDRAKEALQ